MKFHHRESLEVESLLTDDQRRISVNEHQHFQRSLSTDERGVDELDELVEEIRRHEFEERGARP